MSKVKGAFDGLLEDINGIEDLAKSEAAGAAVEGDADGAGAEGEGDDADAEGAGEEGAEGGELAKSFKVTLADGTEQDVIDATDLFKSLGARIETNEETLLKAVTGLVSLVKSLSVQVETLKASGKPRKTVLAIQEKPGATTEPLVKSEERAGLTGEEFLAKAMDAQAAGRISSIDVSIAESHINGGKTPPANIVRAVLGGAQ